jgi:hypothetical protein
MMLFREALKTVRSAGLAPLRIPQVALISAAAERITAPAGGTDKPRPGKNYDRIATEILERLQAGQPLTWRELRDGAWCLWTTKPALCDEPIGLAGIVTGVAAAEQKQPYRALASSFLWGFDAARPGTVKAASVLAGKASLAGRPWAELHASLQLFDPEVGPETVARHAIQQQISPTEILKRGGLGAVDARSGYAKACAAAALGQIAGGAEQDPLRRLERVQALAIGADGRLVFEDQAPLVADALIKPFGGMIPEKSIRDGFLSVLIALFGDPRLNRGRWTRMREAEEVVVRWLTEQSLRQFLDIADRVAKERMWKYRRRFWESVYDAGLVREAWVVFDSYGAAEAQRVFGKKASFGFFVRGGRKLVEQGHTVLLLRIGNGVVADWSHNGKCNIWNDAEAPGAPKLYRGSYTSDEMRLSSGATDAVNNPTFGISHMGAENGNWQSKVAAKIHQMTGVRIAPSRYMVR